MVIRFILKRFIYSQTMQWMNKSFGHLFLIYLQQPWPYSSHLLASLEHFCRFPVGVPAAVYFILDHNVVRWIIVFVVGEKKDVPALRSNHVIDDACVFISGRRWRASNGVHYRVSVIKIISAVKIKVKANWRNVTQKSAKPNWKRQCDIFSLDSLWRHKAG